MTQLKLQVNHNPFALKDLVLDDAVPLWEKRSVEVVVEVVAPGTGVGSIAAAVEGCQDGSVRFVHQSLVTPMFQSSLVGLKDGYVVLTALSSSSPTTSGSGTRQRVSYSIYLPLASHH